MSQKSQLWKIIAISFFLRVFLIVVLSFYEEIEKGEISITDIDYKVYSDSVKYPSPYDRHTYRYTPLLSYMMSLNYNIFECLGKIFFSLFDVVAIYILWHIIVKITQSVAPQRQGDSKDVKQKQIQTHKDQDKKIQHANFVAQLYGYNPLFLYLTVRGSCQSITMALMYAFWYFYLGKNCSGNMIPQQLKNKKIEQSQSNTMHKIYSYVIYGLWVHFRFYPIILLPLILVYEYRNFLNSSKAKFLASFVKMGLIAGGVFVFLLLLFYSLYGEEFVNETYLYHFTRKDNRHSFSPFFYDIYLHFFDSKPLRNLPTLLFIFVMTNKMSHKYSLFYLQFLITFAFVQFNTVITLQYYEWVFGSLLLVLPESRILTFKQQKKGFNLALQWFFGISIWIWMSMKLQGDGDNILFGMWVVCLGKILLDLWVMVQFMKTVKVQDAEEIKRINLQEAKQILLGKNKKN